MEELDIASERSELEREALVNAVRRRPGSGLQPCGACYWCQEVIRYPKLFCDSDCSTDWERRRR